MLGDQIAPQGVHPIDRQPSRTVAIRASFVVEEGAPPFVGAEAIDRGTFLGLTFGRQFFHHGNDVQSTRVGGQDILDEMIAKVEDLGVVHSAAPGHGRFQLIPIASQVDCLIDGQ